MILCLRTYDVSCRESLSAVLISAVEYRSKTLKCKTFHILGCINIIKDLFFNEINLLTEDINKETGLYMISLIAQLKDN